MNGRHPAETFIVLGADDAQSGALQHDKIREVLEDLRISMSAPKVFLLPLDGRSLANGGNSPRASILRTPKSNFPWIGNPAEAIVGVIDHGVNFFHHRFRSTESISRVVYGWMQGGSYTKGRSNVPFGREWMPSEITSALEQHRGDEDALIRLLDTDFSQPGLRPMAFRSTHGTHVLDLAAGAEPDDSWGNAHPIIAVNLPPEVARETSGSLLGLFFLQAFAYVLARARRVMESQNTALPVMVNFSFGLSGGPRGGQHFVERAIDALISHHDEILQGNYSATAPVEIILPAGNRNLARGHVGVSDAKELNATWQVQPADATSNFMEIRIETEPGVPPPVIDLALTPPGDVPALQTRFKPGGPAQWLQDDDATIGRASMQFGDVDPGRENSHVHVLSLALAETEPTAPYLSPASPGPWKLRVGAYNAAPKRIDAWILRDDTPPGFRDPGRQSYFVDSDYQERGVQGALLHTDPKGKDHGILRAGTLNAIATGKTHRIVGGHIGGVLDSSNAYRPAPYSGNPLPGTSERITDWGECERSNVLTGVLAAGTRSGTRVAINGTSVAAPQVLRRMISPSGD